MALAVALSAEATRAQSGSVCLCTGNGEGRVPLGAPLACVSSFAAALQNSECTDFQPLPAMA